MVHGRSLYGYCCEPKRIVRLHLDFSNSPNRTLWERVEGRFTRLDVESQNSIVRAVGSPNRAILVLPEPYLIRFGVAFRKSVLCNSSCSRVDFAKPGAVGFCEPNISLIVSAAPPRSRSRRWRPILCKDFLHRIKLHNLILGHARYPDVATHI